MPEATDKKNGAMKNPVDDSSSLVFAVMPQGGNYVAPTQKMEEVRPPQNSSRPEVATHLWQTKTPYIIIGLLILVILGALAYFLLWSAPTPADEPSQSKLPKIFLQKHFSAAACADMTVCGDEADPDNDGLTNYYEFIEQTDPNKNDFDEDGLADGDEIYVYLTNPIKKYTDPRAVAEESGYTDGSQIKNEYDPLAPGLKMSVERKAQIARAIQEHTLHEPTKTTLAAPVAKTVNIFIANNKFDQASTTISVGDTVIWLNKDVTAHQIASDPHPTHTALPELESGSLATNQTYSFKFMQPGTFGYHDHFNPSIKGIIKVQ
jgi:plastocyanin